MPTRSPIIPRADTVAVARLLMSLLFAIIPTSNAFAQKVDGETGEAVLNSEWHFRHELFQMLLEERGLKVAESLDAALESPRDSVIVMIGKLGRVHSANAENLSTFAERGGAVLLALAGALHGATAADAYSVECGPTTMSQADIDNGRTIVQISLAPAASVERITVTLTLDEGQTPQLEAA